MIEIEIEDPAWTAALPDAAEIAKRAAGAALGQTGPAREGLAVLLTDDDSIAALNARFRAKTGPTNVLSFPAPPSAGPHLGDIALAYGVCAREAAEQGKSLGAHLMHLVAHGVLHLVGYDHQTEAEAETMEALERQLMRELGAPDPYERAPAAGHHAG